MVLADEVGYGGTQAVVSVGEELADRVGEQVLIAECAESIDILGQGGAVGRRGDEAVAAATAVRVFRAFRIFRVLCFLWFFCVCPAGEQDVKVKSGTKMSLSVPMPPPIADSSESHTATQVPKPSVVI